MRYHVACRIGHHDELLLAQVIAFASDVSLLTLVFPVAMLLYALPSQSPHPRFWHVRPHDLFTLDNRQP